MPAIYGLAPQVKKVAENLIAQEIMFEHYQQFNIAYLFTSEMPDWSAKIEKVNPKIKLLTEVDIILTVAKDQWVDMTDLQQEALIFHELCHIIPNGEGKLIGVKHDVEEFSQVLRRYGPWDHTRRQMFEQLKLWEDDEQSRFRKHGLELLDNVLAASV